MHLQTTDGVSGYRRLLPVPSESGRWRRMLERQFDVARLVNFDQERDPALGIAHGERFAGVLARDRIHDLELRIGPALDDAATQLRFRVRVLEVDDRQGDPRIATGIRGLQRAFAGADQEAIAVSAHPDRHTPGGIRRALMWRDGRSSAVSTTCLISGVSAY